MAHYAMRKELFTRTMKRQRVKALETLSILRPVRDLSTTAEPDQTVLQAIADCEEIVEFTGKWLGPMHRGA